MKPTTARNASPYQPGPGDVLGGLLILVLMWLALDAAPVVDELIQRGWSW